jgi:hypothetical protein
MPRKGRGGSRQGTPGTAYGNRTDLNLPASAAPDQEYGKATEQLNAQRAVPMASSPQPSAPQAAPMAPAGAPLPQPGTMPHLGPTNRPNEPVTHGMPFGPGGGPEVLQGQQPSLGELLRTLAGQPNASSKVLDIASAASSLGL